MKFYFVNAESCARTTPRSTRRAARSAAADSYDDIEVQQVEITTDSGQHLRLLNVARNGHPQGVVYTAKAR